MATSTLKAVSLVGRTSKRGMSHMSKRPSVLMNWQNEVYHVDWHIQDFSLRSRIKYWVSLWNQSLKRYMSISWNWMSVNTMKPKSHLRNQSRLREIISQSWDSPCSNFKIYRQTSSGTCQQKLKTRFQLWWISPPGWNSTFGLREYHSHN